MECVRLPVSRIYTSPLRRALESAQIMARGAEITVLAELAEISLGECDGRAWADIEGEYPALAATKLADWKAATPPGGETWSAFRSRITRGLEKILSEGKAAALIGHIAVNACVAETLNASNPVDFRQDYGEVYEYQF
jgi:probable phosphoglycerate mutase